MSLAVNAFNYVKLDKSIGKCLHGGLCLYTGMGMNVCVHPLDFTESCHTVATAIVRFFQLLALQQSFQPPRLSLSPFRSPVCCLIFSYCLLAGKGSPYIAQTGFKLVILVPRCCSLDRYGPHRLMYLNAWPIGSTTIRKCGLVGVGVVLLQEVCHCWGRL